MSLTRRHFVSLATLAASSAPKLLRADDGPPRRRIFASGGAMLLPPEKDRPLLKRLVALTGKTDPQICFLPTAQADAPQAIVGWYESTADLPCRPRHLRLINNATNLKNLEAQLLGMDAIFVGGGNTLSMLAIWKAHGIDALLRKAWEKGIVLSGESAGMICWFEQGVSDSNPGELSAIDGLGWLKGSACPHYHRKDRTPSCQRLLLKGDLKEGIACDEGVALLYEGETLSKVLTAVPGATAYKVRCAGGKFVDEAMAAESAGK